MLNKENHEIKYEDIITDEFKAEVIFKSSKDGLRILNVGFAMVIIFSLFVFTCAIDKSMEPKIYENDIVIFKTANKDYKRGDIIAFFLDGEKYPYCKRVIGLPNDTVEFSEDGDVLINGILLEENYIESPSFGNNGENKIVVPEGQYYVLGDNRCISYDSRYFGTIKKEQIKGKLILLIPTSKIIKKSQPSVYGD